MNPTFPDLVRSRRSIRSFSGEPIPEDVLGAILDLAAYAPSSWGGHPVEFIVIRDRETMCRLVRCKRMGAGPLADGDAAIVPIVSVASTFILLAAEYYGVAACWIHMKDRRGHTGTAEEDIRALLGIPSHYGILNAVSLGMPRKPNEPRELKGKVHRGRYGG